MANSQSCHKMGAAIPYWPPLSHSSHGTPCTFLRRLIDPTKGSSHFTCLNIIQVFSDLQWWACFLHGYLEWVLPLTVQYLLSISSYKYICMDYGAVGRGLPAITAFKCSGHHFYRSSTPPYHCHARRWCQLSWRLPFGAGTGMAKQCWSSSLTTWLLLQH